MKTKDLVAKYDKVLQDVSKNIKHINCGGCGIYALELGKVLEQQKVKFKYIMLFHRLTDTHKKDIKEVIKNNRITEFNYYSWTHVVIKVGRKYFDGESVCDKLNKTYLPISQEFLTEMVGNEKMWNYMFNRRQTPKLRTILKKHLVVSK